MLAHTCTLKLFFVYAAIRLNGACNILRAGFIAEMRIAGLQSGSLS